MSSTTRRLTLTVASLLLSGAAAVSTAVSPAVTSAVPGSVVSVAAVGATVPVANGIGWD